jgi:hypothetical protein
MTFHDCTRALEATSNRSALVGFFKQRPSLASTYYVNRAARDLRSPATLVAFVHASRRGDRCERPRQDSNLGTRFRKPMLYPLSYEGGVL